MKQIKIGLIILLVLLIAYQVVTISRTQKNRGNAPIISSSVDEIQILCQYNQETLLQGLTAYDAEDGYITKKILIGSFTHFTEKGVASLDYAVYDQDGNIAIFNRKVVFRDYVSPRIKVLAPCVFRATNNAYNFPSLLSYLEGWDKLDGDISKHLLLISNDVDFTEPGKYTASVYLKNSFGDEVNLNLPIHVLEPGLSGIAIELKEPLIYVNKEDVVNPEDYIASIRNEYTNEILPEEGYELIINSDVDISKDGIYEIQFSAVSSDKLQSGETWMTVVVGNYGG